DIQSISALFSENMHLATDLINGIFSKELNKLLLDRNIDIFPSWDEITHRCSCGKTKKCEHTAAVLHRIFNEVIFEPMLLFSLRGLKCKDIFSIMLNDPDFGLSGIELPSELLIEHYNVKSSEFNVSGIDPLNYYGVEIPEIDLSDVKPSRLTDSRIYQGKIRDEFYEIYDSLSEMLKINIKKY
ncbi:MAG: hypothetical protein KKD38_00915, partial [Candidatus Delongbacteria bacterium]|nr:hypothetical protein [Candidatus Delongbacteria bacterium]MCG2761083.1 hypothetical protein [Candidatus Delongbacteria bacterium]